MIGSLRSPDTRAGREEKGARQRRVNVGRMNSRAVLAFAAAAEKFGVVLAPPSHVHTTIFLP